MFCKKSSPLVLRMAGIECRDQKEMYRTFYRNCTVISRNFPQFYRNFFRLGGPPSPPPPPALLQIYSDCVYLECKFVLTASIFCTLCVYYFVARSLPSFAPISTGSFGDSGSDSDNDNARSSSGSCSEQDNRVNRGTMCDDSDSH